MASPSYPTSHDLTTEDGITAYLTRTPFACTKAEALSGGNANFVYRLHLQQLYQGEKATLVLKHGKSYVKSMSDISFDTKRQIFEVEAFRRVREWSSSTSFITVPNVYHHDKTNHVMIMDDCGSDSMTLKEYMRKGHCSMETALRIGKKVGTFIGQLHSWGKRNKDAVEFFDGNQEAKEICSLIYYGRLVTTFDEALPKLRDPDVQLNSEERTALKDIAEETGNAMRNTTDTLVMGDYWPGNFVLSFDSEKNIKQILVLDWEACRPGILGCELGQFCAELIQLTRFDTEICGDTAMVMLENLLNEYTNYITPDLDMCRRAVVHLGAHLIVWSPRIEWGGKETTQQIVKEGLKLVLEGYSAEREWLGKSVIGPLVKKIT